MQPEHTRLATRNNELDLFHHKEIPKDKHKKLSKFRNYLTFKVQN